MILTATNLSPDELARLKAAFSGATPAQLREAAAGLYFESAKGGKWLAAPPRLELRELVRPKSLEWLELRHLAEPIQRSRGKNSVIVAIRADLAKRIAGRLMMIRERLAA